MNSNKKLKILFLTDIHQNLNAVKKINFSSYDLVLCGGDILTPNDHDLVSAKNIIDSMPEDTIIIPGNCDKNSDLLNYIKKRMIFLHMDFVTKKNINILGIGYSRAIKDDIRVYRNFFIKEKKRIDYFLGQNNLPFILKYCGIEKNDKNEIVIQPENTGMEQLEDFAGHFVSFQENEITDFFNTFDNKNNKIDIMLTHSPAYGLLDKLNGLPNIGSKAIKEGIKKVKPKLVLCGHFHELIGNLIYNDSIIFNPGAVKDNKYGEIEIYNDNIKVFYKTI
ncbi:MAG: metallophosphoesterase [Spirochaetes bacterium]|nr:metallophosphoesterase [Spirochaetota bacterium]